MDWQTYNTTISPLIKRFGSFKYTVKYITNHFFYWKEREQSELLDIVNQCISFNQELDLKPATNKDTGINSTQSYIESMDNLQITDGYLQRLLKANNCSSLLELIQKQKDK
jgi:hypothetical protein